MNITFFRFLFNESSIENEDLSLDKIHYFKNGQYETIKKLGSGTFGTVFLVSDKFDNNLK